MQGETRGGARGPDCLDVSIHSPYAGRDSSKQWRKTWRPRFNPLSLCRERRGNSCTGFRKGRVSIHSPYAGRDTRPGLWCRRPACFNPLSLCRERQNRLRHPDEDHVFQSTLPMQGETFWLSHATSKAMFQSTLPMQGETFALTIVSACLGCFNPLSLCRERRQDQSPAVSSTLFQSTLPMQGETSFHPLSVILISSFNPLSLCRERLCSGRIWGRGKGVSIHSPYAGRDACDLERADARRVSIHSPYAGRDRPAATRRTSARTFQSTLPMQGETRFGFGCRLDGFVSIHSPYAGRDPPDLTPAHGLILFQSTLPMQGETRTG